MNAMTEGHAVRVVRSYDATPERVFACFTDPALVATWWGPGGVNCPGAEAELKVGGRFRFAMRSDDGTTDTAACGEYLAIERPWRLVFSGFWEPNPTEVSRVSVSLRKIDAGRTELTLVHDRFDSEETAALHETGWSSSLECLGLAIRS